MQGILLPFNDRTGNHGHDITVFASNPILPTFTEDGFCRSSTILTTVMGMMPWIKKLNPMRLSIICFPPLYISKTYVDFTLHDHLFQLRPYSQFGVASASLMQLAHRISNCSAVFMPVSLTIFLCLSFVHHKGSQYFVSAAVHKIMELGKQGLMINWMRPLCMHTFVMVIS